MISLNFIIILIANIIFIIVIINIATTTTTTTTTSVFKNDNLKYIFYDCNHLIQIPKKKISSIQSDKKVNCNSNVIDCQNDQHCIKKCIKLNDGKLKRKCIKGICNYSDTKSQSCKNGGFPTTYFEYGRIVTGCICNDNNYIGKYCDISNVMNKAYDKDFELVY